MRVNGSWDIYAQRAGAAMRRRSSPTRGVTKVALPFRRPLIAFVLDTVTRRRTVIDVRLPAPSAAEVFALSPDNRTIYYPGIRSEADIWMVERR